MGFLVKGDRVTIYEDPVTCQKREGRATIIEITSIMPNKDLAECLVRFVGEDETFTRQVNINNNQ